MNDLERILDYWPVFLSILGLVVWLVRLEGRIGQVSDRQNHTDKEVDTLRVKHEQLDSKIVEQLGQVRESLARLEGALGIKRD